MQEWERRVLFGAHVFVVVVPPHHAIKFNDMGVYLKCFK